MVVVVVSGRAVVPGLVLHSSALFNIYSRWYMLPSTSPCFTLCLLNVSLSPLSFPHFSSFSLSHHTLSSSSFSCLFPPLACLVFVFSLLIFVFIVFIHHSRHPLTSPSFLPSSSFFFPPHPFLLLLFLLPYSFSNISL